ncbi:MAG: Fur family transcriptional regulator [Thermoleophilaceae bacterium]
MNIALADPDTTLSSALRARGQRVTPQRLAIARVVRELHTHATAEQVLTAVSARMPGVSLPTVYATLELLEELGSVRRVNVRGGAVLYDAEVDPHQHMVCTSCGAVTDVAVAPAHEQAAFAAARAAGFSPESAETVIRGLCSACAA